MNDSQEAQAPEAPEAPESPKSRKPRRKYQRRNVAADVVARLAEAQKAQVKNEQEIAKLRDARIKEISKGREALVSRIADFDAEVLALGGTVSKPKRKSKVGRPAGSKTKAKSGRKPKAKVAKVAKAQVAQPAKKGSLQDAVASVLKGKSKGMRLKDIQVALEQSGYKTKAKNLYPLIAQAVRGSQFKTVERGVYVVS